MHTYISVRRLSRTETPDVEQTNPMLARDRRLKTMLRWQPKLVIRWLAELVMVLIVTDRGTA